MLPLHQDHISSLYEARTHPPGSKDQHPNQLGEQTIFADEERLELSTLPLTRERSAIELFILLFVDPMRLELMLPRLKAGYFSQLSYGPVCCDLQTLTEILTL